MDRLLTFLIELGLLAGGVFFLFLLITWLLSIVEYWRRTRDGVHVVVTDATGQPILTSRGSRDLHRVLQGLGFTRLGVMGARWPWHRKSTLIPVDRSPDGRVVAQSGDSPGLTWLVLGSRLEDGFDLMTVFPDRLHYVDDRVESAGSMTSPAAALDEHLARLLAAEAKHGPALVFHDLAEFIRLSTEPPGTTPPGYRWAVLRPRIRGTFTLAAVWLGLLFVFTFQLLRVVDTASARPPTVIWSAIDLPGGQVRSVEALISTSAGFVAVGETGAGQEASGAVWTSDDGQAWQLRLDGLGPSPDAVAADPSRRVEIFGVAAGSTGLVAVGRVSSSLNDSAEAQVWTSTDGSTWSRNDGVTGLDGTPFYVALDGARVVATGRADPPPTTPQTQGSIGMIWTSIDGMAWQRASFPPADLLYEVVHGSAGFVALSVRDVLADSGSYEALLHSTDGLTWTDGAIDQVRDHEHVDDLVALDHGYLAFGEPGSVWRSEDGATWRRVSVDSSLFGHSRFNRVAAGPLGIVAAGAMGSFVDPKPGAWMSPDGQRWSPIAEPPLSAKFGGFHVAVGPDRLVLLGTSHQGSDGAVGVIEGR